MDDENQLIRVGEESINYIEIEQLHYDIEHLVEEDNQSFINCNGSAAG